MTCEEIVGLLQKHADPSNVEGMARYGINPRNTLGVSVGTLRTLAKDVGTNHSLALRLWETSIHEARILASIVDDPSNDLPEDEAQTMSPKLIYVDSLNRAKNEEQKDQFGSLLSKL